MHGQHSNNSKHYQGTLASARTLRGQANTVVAWVQAAGSAALVQSVQLHNNMTFDAVRPSVNCTTERRFRLLSGALGSASAPSNPAFLHLLTCALERWFHAVAALRAAMGSCISPAS